MERDEKLGIQLLERIHEVVGKGEKYVPLHVPEFNGRERELLLDCIETGWVSSVGSYVDEFEIEVARRAGCSYGVAVSNGTAALHIGLIVAGVQPSDEVLVPTLTFVATANAVSYIGATPHFIDSAYDTLGVCPKKLRVHLDKIAEVREGQTWNRITGKRIAAIVPMHVFGCPVDFNSLHEVISEWPMKIVEDAAESLGSSYTGYPCGSLGELAAFSFNGNKIITTGGGGALVTNNIDMAQRAKHLSTTAKTSHAWNFIHDEVGFNYRLPNLNAALGIAQLEQLDARLVNKRRLFDRYKIALSGVDGMKVFTPPRGSISNNWLITIMLDVDYSTSLSYLLELLNDAGIMARPAWTPMHYLPMYSAAPRANLMQAEDLASRLLNIPSSAYLGLESEFAE